MYEQTTGTNPDPIYISNVTRLSSWGRSWGFSWGLSWGFVQETPFLDTSGTSPQSIFEEGSGSVPSIFDTTTGDSPNIIYEEN